jgi:hypothetical protein
MKELFKVAVKLDAQGLPTLQWSFRHKDWDHLQRTVLGKTLLFTDRDRWTDEQIVRAYRSQSHVEAAFRRMDASPASARACEDIVEEDSLELAEEALGARDRRRQLGEGECILMAAVTAPLQFH